MAITKGAPTYLNKFNHNTTIFTQNKDKENTSEIQVPNIGLHYGNIYCERIGLEAPLYYGDKEEILLEGAGQHIASGLPGEGRTILIGGHDITYFAPLEQIEVDDIVEIETSYGKFQYQITSTIITHAQDDTAYDLTLQEEQLILYTCYPFGKVVGDRERFFVYGQKIQNVAEDE